MIPQAGIVNAKKVLRVKARFSRRCVYGRGNMEESNMVSHLVPRGILAAAAGAALMIVASSGPSSAFTLSSPSLDQPVVTANIQHVWWDRWGRWHPNIWGWGWRHPYWGWRHPYLWWRHPWRHCWWNGYARICRW
jgi:hypothetical protein